MTDDNGYKRKCVNFTVKDKLNILKKLDAGASTTLVAQEHGLNPTTIRRWRSNRQIIEKENNDCSDKKRVRTSRYEKLNEALYVWFRERRARGLLVSGPILKEKALVLNEKLGITSDFNANEGWLARFKEKYGIRQSVTGEKLTAENNGEKFSHPGESLLDCQIFYADETGLNYKLLPNKTLDDGEDGRAVIFKQNRDRVTVLVCSNADGSLKLPLHIVGKWSDPRALKNISKNSLPVRYTSQRSTWMNFQIFEDWFQNDFVPKVTDFLKQRELPINAVLFLNNTPAHPSDEKLAVNDIKIRFLPPNVTSVIEFMAQGVIDTLKKHYRLKFLQSILNNQSDGLDLSNSLKSVTIKEFIYWVSSAWDEIDADYISQCWKPLLNPSNPAEHHSTEETNSPQKLNIAILNLLNRVDNYEHATIADIIDWAACDNDPLSPMPSDDDVIHSVSNNFDPEESTNENCDSDTRTAVTTALEAAKELMKYCEESGNIPLDDLMALRRIHDRVLINKIL